MGYAGLSSTALQKYSRIRTPKLQDFERTEVRRLGPYALRKHVTDTPLSHAPSALEEVAFRESQTHCETKQTIPIRQRGAGGYKVLKDYSLA